ncbi:MAG TPA: DUF2637 domain-containing protein [Actinoplanes sp.]|jgi:hypothetical protein
MTTGERVESTVLALILAVVAVAAGWASFTHVHDWTMRHAPTGTPGAFGWVNAVISELVPVAAFLTIRRRRRAGAPIGYPVVLLLASAALSLGAQLAVASPSPSGWLLSAVPALAFMALVKLVFATHAEPHSAARVDTASDTDDTTSADLDPSSTVDSDPGPSSGAPASPHVIAPISAEAFSRVNGAPAGRQVRR